MIPFPQYHIATSVVNRILNVHAELKNARNGFVPPAPNTPEPLPSGPELDRMLLAPVPPVDATPQVAQQVALNPLLR